MKKFVDTMRMGVVGVLIIGLFGYALFRALYVYNPSWVPTFASYVADNPQKMVGLPVSAITAFAIVCVLDGLAKSDGSSEKLEFKAFSLTFSGPAAPVTLWVVCYLALVGSMKVL